MSGKCEWCVTVNDSLDSPDAEGDDEADGVPGAAGAVSHRGGHHWGQREYNHSPVKYLIKQQQHTVMPFSL